MEISSEQVNLALNRYAHELSLSHVNTSEASLHITIAAGMRKVLYDLGVLDEQSNHEIVEMSYKSPQKKRQVK